MPSGAANATDSAEASLLLLHDDDDDDDDGGEAELREDEEDEAAALLLLPRGLDVTGGRGMMAAMLAQAYSDGGAEGGEQMALLRRRSVNTTECVAVPSSEHVAEIVGRQGCRIKALRTKTNTYIKTPVRGEEPVFVVTGRREDVAVAKREILSAAEHFSAIRASRGRAAGPCRVPALPGHTTVRVRVPYRVVGLVVGPRGATIKRIQRQTHTYIVTPGRDREPVFEVTGVPENVDRAREEIELHIALRTGAFLRLGRRGDFRDNGTDVGFEGGPAWPRARPAMGSSYRNGSSSSLGSASTDSCLGGGRLADFSPASPFGAGAFWVGEALPAAGAEELPLDSPAYEPLPAPSPTVWAPLEPAAAPPGPGGEPVGSARAPRRGSRPPSPRLSPAFPEGLEQPPAGRARSSPQPGLPLCIPAFSAGTNSCSSSAGGSASSSPPECRRRRGCALCWDGEAGAALVPCGHSLLCPPCARRLCASDAPACPVCQAAVTQAVHIHR